VRLAKRILSTREIKEWHSITTPASAIQYLAVRLQCSYYMPISRYCLNRIYRFAVKEAAYKALQPDFAPTWKQLALIQPDSTRKPMLLFEALAFSHPPTFHCSISHDGEYLVAFVVAERSGRLRSPELT